MAGAQEALDRLGDLNPGGAPGTVTPAQVAPAAPVPTPSTGVRLTPPAPPAPPVGASRRRQPRVVASVPPPPPPPPPVQRRATFADAFGSAAETVQVWRLEGDVPTEVIGREFPRAYLDACGMDVHTFVLRNIVPDFGPGDYLVRGIGPQGPVGEARVRVAGSGESSQHHRLSETFGRIDRDGRPYHPDGRPKTYAEALADVQALKALEKLTASDDPLRKEISSLRERIEQVAISSVPIAAPAAPDPLDQMLKFKQIMGADKPAVDPTIVDLVKRMDERIAKMEEQRKQDQLTAVLEELRATKAQLQQVQQGGGIAGFKQQFNELQEVSQIISPPGGGGFSELLATLAQSWTPGAIAEMVERTAEAQLRAKIAERRALGLGAERRPAPPPVAPPPLAKVVPLEERKKLVEAPDDAALLVGLVPVVKRLNAVEKVKPALAQMFGALALGTERGDHAVEQHVKLFVDLMFGENKQKELAERITAAMIENRSDVIAAVEQHAGVKIQRPTVKPPPTPAPVVATPMDPSPDPPPDMVADMDTPPESSSEEGEEAEELEGEEEQD